MPPPPPGYGAPDAGSSRYSKLAIAALVVAIVGAFLPFIGAIIAIALGISGLLAVSNAGGKLRGKGLAIAALVIAALSMVAWGLAASQWFDDAGGGFLETVFSSQKASSQLDIGDCLDMETEDSTSFEVSSRDVVSCAEPHGGEYIGSFFAPEGDDVPYPGEDPVFEQAYFDCIDKFEDYVGTDYYQDPNYDVLVWFPLEDSWERFNDRESACFVMSIDGSDFIGSARAGS